MAQPTRRQAIMEATHSESHELRVIICIIPDPEAHPNQPMLSVEFCTSGGGSPRTHAALLNLLEAMEQDNHDYHCHGRAVPARATPSMRD